MKNFTLVIQCDNAAFEEDEGRPEIARLLREAASFVEKGHALHFSRYLSDINGNVVAQFDLKETK